MIITAGNKFICKKSVTMTNGSIAYIQGKVYTSEKDGCITDEQGDKNHICITSEWADIYFSPFKNVILSDNVKHPSHYTWIKELCGIEVIDITRHMDFCLGNAIKYILRAGHKKDASLSDNQKEIEDLQKAIFYIQDKIQQLKKKDGNLQTKA